MRQVVSAHALVSFWLRSSGMRPTPCSLAGSPAGTVYFFAMPSIKDLRGPYRLFFYSFDPSRVDLASGPLRAGTVFSRSFRGFHPRLPKAAKTSPAACRACLHRAGSWLKAELEKSWV